MSVEQQRPLPEPNVVTRPFWDGAAEKRLLYPRCDECERAFFPPHLVCPHCRSAKWSWSQSVGRGEIYSFSVVHRAPQPGFETPYVIAVVDLDEGFDLMTNIVGVDPGGVAIGQRVQVDWLEVGEMVLPVFTPDEAMEDVA